MFLNTRTKSKQLIQYEALARRSTLTREQGRRLKFLQSGYQGEAAYDRLFDEAGHGNLLIYRDLWLKIENATLQIDALVITDDLLTVNEIKNYSGIYSCDNEGWYINGRQISENPLAQVSRTAGKLMRMQYLQSVPFKVEKKAVFVNPNLHLTINSKDNALNIVERSLLRPYFKDLKSMNAGPQASELSNLIEAFIIEDPMELPEHKPEHIKSGNCCYQCGSFKLEHGKFIAVCKQCGYHETNERIVLRSIIDFTALFPNSRLNKNNIHHFVGKIQHERSITKLLNKYCIQLGNGKSTYYRLSSLDFETILKDGGYKSRYEKEIVMG
ncbi:nuclease-related domain-containing protein [Salinicoccus albus]|uniref:nuclease-related domain-containing protein n=1 Tax=Salinicoccus albus TaxID=418756 RepID=UPI000375CFE2|nr:nuclease-related domain-containing protein [Salinicoccus albus]